MSKEDELRSMKKKIVGAAAMASGIYMGFGWSFFNLTVRCKKNRKESKKKWFQLHHTKINHPRYEHEEEYEEGKEWCRQQKMQDCFIRSRDGLKLHGYYLPAKDAKRFVLLCHGYKGSGFGDFANMARFLHENQCNLLFIDQRCCGSSQGEYITFGAMEQYDIQKWAYYISLRNKNKLPIYLYGESMGAASVLMASGHHLPREVKGLISDCGFFSMESQVRDMAANWFHLNHIGSLIFRLKFFCRTLAGFQMREADTTEAMRRNQRPILFFHGGKDTYVDPKNTKYNYSLCHAPKEFVEISEARHLCCAYEKPEYYRQKVMNFFHQYDT